MDFGGSMEVAALGRPFCLGMLYDCRRDLLVPGMTLWNHDDLKKHIEERPQNYNDFEIVASESIEDKSKALNVEGSLKASFLSGLVEVEGSAKYLKDEKTSRNQARVTLKYKATTNVKELSMNHLGRGKVKHPYVFEKGIATHVVTAILYGAQAFFVFDREVSESEDHQDIQGNLKVIIKKIPSIVMEGEGSLNMEDEDKASVEKFSCKFHGDFFLEKNPVSFQDAVQVYQSLPKLLGSNGEKAVPVKVWLLPLTSLDSSAARLVRQISIGLVQEVQKVLEDFSELELRCNDAMRTTTAEQFPQIGKKLKTFKEMCSVFKLEFQQTLSVKLPSIRGGGEEEAVLAEILMKRHSSPFNSKHLTEWMDCKEREIYTLRSFTKMMKNTETISSQNRLNEEILSAEQVMCFVFTSLGDAESYLSALSNYLLSEPTKPDEPQGQQQWYTSQGIANKMRKHLSALSKYLKGTTTPDDPQDPYTCDVEKEQWYLSNKVPEEMRKKAKLFCDFAEANKENKDIKFLTVGLTNETQKGSSIYLHEDGFSLSENFEPPSKPETVEASDINHNSVTLKISPPRFGVENIASYSVEYCVHGEDGWQQKTASKDGDVTVSDLSPNTEYVFRCRAVTSVGVGPVNEVSGTIRTLPCSPPGNAKMEMPECFQRLADAVKKESTLLEPQSGPMPVYKIPLQQEDSAVKGCKRFRFGEESLERNRTIMVLGATGAGKSTLINGMINYVLGVEWNDPYRFKLVDEDQSTSQAHSQTTEVTTYKLNRRDGFKIENSLTIVDTPGFGDTRGIEKDKLIVEQLRDLFSAKRGVSEIDAVCFVVQASLARLTPTQKYVFDSVLSIFGKDVAENIRILVTFADGQRPPVLEAINAACVPCPKTEEGLPVHFKFNNSALFAQNKSCAAESAGEDGEGDFDQMFWNMGIKRMRRFFSALNVMRTKSLTMTKDVLRERQQLEVSVQSLQKQVQIGLAKIEELKETTTQLTDHEAEIRRNKDFVIACKVMKPSQHKITGSGTIITNCGQCNFTCHDNCIYAQDADKIRCSAMGSDGKCKQCPGKCIWSVHFNQEYRWVYEEVTERITVKDLEKKYLKATGAKTSVKALIDKLKAAYDLVKAEVVKVMGDSTKCLNRLKEIALKPNPLSTPEYIDMLIEGERAEAKSGWKTRVQYLMDMRGQAEVMAKVDRREEFLQSSSRDF